MKYIISYILLCLLLLVTSGCSLSKNRSIQHVSQENTSWESRQEIAYTPKHFPVFEGEEINQIDTSMPKGSITTSLPPRAYLNDAWTLPVQYTSDTITTQAIEQFLQSDRPLANATTQELKHAHIDAHASQLTLSRVWMLMDVATCIDCTMTTEWDSLTIIADRPNDNASWLIISPDLKSHILIEDGNDRFGEAIYMIPKKEYSLLKIHWGSTVEGIEISYHTQSEKHHIASVWWYNETWSIQEDISVPKNTSFTLSPSWWRGHTNTKDSYKARVYHLFSTQQQYDKKTALYEALGAYNPSFVAWLEAYEWFDRYIDYALIHEGDIDTLAVQTNDADFQAFLVVEPTHAYILDITTSEFTSSFHERPTYDSVEGFAYEINSSHPIDKTKTHDALEGVFGSGRVNYDYGLTIRLDPWVLYTGTVDIYSLYGDKQQIPMSVQKDNFSPDTIHQSILSNNTISILPKSGTFQDIIIQYKNIEKFAVDFQACEILPFSDESLFMNEFKWSGIEDYFFTCDDETTHSTLVSPLWEIFAPWQTYRTSVPIPKWLEAYHAFRVSFTDSNGKLHSHYLLKTDIGAWTKIDQVWLHVWSFAMDTGELLSQWTVHVQTIDGKDIATESINGTWYSFITLPMTPYDYDTHRKDATYIVTIKNKHEETFVIAHASWDDSIFVPTQRDRRSININSKLSTYEVQHADQEAISMRWYIDPLKIYGYTDRAMYKIWDEIHLAWFVRDILQDTSVDDLSTKTVSIGIQTPDGSEAFFLDGITLDAYAWFTWSWTIPAWSALWDYFVTYTLDTDDMVSYTHSIKVQEYQKPTFFADIRVEEEEGELSLLVSPEYYFGEALSTYDVHLTWSLESQQQCWYCWWWHDDEAYFNHTFDTVPAAAGNQILYDQDEATVRVPLIFDTPQDNLSNKNKAYKRTLKVEAIIKDRASDETQFFTEYVDYLPDVSLGMTGQPYERLYQNKKRDTRQWWSTEIVLSEGKERIDTLAYEIYYHSYEHALRAGVDAHMYYINDMQYIAIATGTFAWTEDVFLPKDFINEPGSYFVRVFAYDSKKKLIGEVHKKISFYAYGMDDDPQAILGAVPNNYSLLVAIPEKTYNLWEDIPLNISPYMSGSNVIITVEKGQYILDTYVKKLDGNQLRIPVKESYAPNVIINVMQIQGTSMSSEKRKEPRFFAWYADVAVNSAVHELDIELWLDKDTYEPWEEATITITTKNYAGKPIDARVSVAVIDQALVNLYHRIKQPLEHFFTSAGTSVHTYTNMKLLYQSLKAFATWWSKWGDGWWGKAMIGFVRNDLKDTAFRKADVITSWWTADISFTVPDNMTTWLVDAIAVWPQNQLWTQTKNFVVQQPFIVEWNPPLYMTLGDTIHMPIKMFVAEDIMQDNIQVEWSVMIRNAWWDTLTLWTFAALPEQKVRTALYMPPEWKDTPYITAIVSATYGDYEDAIEQIIPIRSDGLIIRETAWSISKQWTFTTHIPESYTHYVSFRLGMLPTNFIDPLVDYLSHYPYGCAEQTTSKLLSLLSVLHMQKIWIFSSDRIDEHKGIIHTSKGPLDIDVYIDDALRTLLKYQDDTGLFSYRNTASPEIPSQDQYRLTAYVYGALHEVLWHTQSTSSIQQALQKAEHALWTYRTLDDDSFLYYLLQKAMYTWTLTEREQNTLSNIDSMAWYRPLLRYLIAVYEQNQKDKDLRRPLAVVPTNDAWWYNPYMHQVIAEAYVLRASFLDDAVLHETSMNRLDSLLKQRDAHGLRSQSSQTNLQVMKALVDASKLWSHDKTIQCTLRVGEHTHIIEVSKNTPLVTQNSSFWSGWTIHLSWECDTHAFVDIFTAYMPKDLTEIDDAMNHVSHMQRDISDLWAPIGTAVTIWWSFTTDLAGEDVAVDLFVPADYKLLDVISAKDGTQNYPFTVSDRHCYPNHWETRFDRLFLFYDNLPAGTCDITVEALKAYEWNTTVMPFRIWEMYRWSVNGRKIVK